MSRGHRSCTKRPCLCLLLSIQKIQMLKACVTELSLCPQSKMSGPHTEIFEMTWKLPELLKATPNQAQSRLGEEPRWEVPQRRRIVCEGRRQRGVGWGGRRVAWPGSEGLGGGRAPSSGEAGTVHSGLRQTRALRRWCRRALGWDTKSTCVPILLLVGRKLCPREPLGWSWSFYRRRPP